MEEDKSIIKLCRKGMKMEQEGRPDIARDLFIQAWKASSDNYEACIAAHFVARQQDSAENTLHWNKESLKLADETRDSRVNKFYPSLYLCVGLSYETLHDSVNAGKYIDLAFEKVGILPNDDYGKGIRKNLDEAKKRIRENLKL